MTKITLILKKISALFLFILLSLSFATVTTQASTPSKIIYRFSPSADKCYASGTKEYKKLYRNRIYKTLVDCQKKLKNKSAVLGAFEKKGGGASTSVSLEIK